MPTVKEEAARLKWLVEHGKGEEKCKVILVVEESQKRVANKEGRTRLIVQLDTAATYSEFSAQFARYKELTGNPQIAYQVMLDLLRALPDESITRMAHAESTEIT